MNDQVNFDELENEARALEGEVLQSNSNTQHHQEQTADDKAIEKMLSLSVVMITSFIATRRGDHWQATEQEADSIAASVNTCLNHYFGGIATSPLVGLALTVFAYAAPRAMADVVKQKEDNKKNNETATDEKK